MLRELGCFFRIVSPESEFEKKVVPSLQGFLDRNHRPIGAIRTLAQIRDGQFEVEPEDEEGLKNFVTKESNGQLKWWHGSLCIIYDYAEIFQHSGVYFGEGLKRGIKAVRGLWFDFELVGKYFECVVLDHGYSREYFDNMTRKRRRQFIGRFVYRDLGEAAECPGRLHPEPIGAVVFSTDTGKGFKIEEIVARRGLKL